MRKRGWVLLWVFVAVFSFSGVAKAELMVIGTATYASATSTNINTSLSETQNIYQLIYDDDEQLVWMDYTRGGLSWQSMVSWASELGGNLTIALNPGYTTSIDWTTGWRLPVTVEQTGGSNRTDSEMGRLFYTELGNSADLYGGALENTGPFLNLRTTNLYWSGTEYWQFPEQAWAFNFYTGCQFVYSKVEYGFYGLAVHPGQVSAAAGNGTDPHPGNGNGTDPAPVPEPATMLLLGSGLLGLVGLRRKFRK